MPETMKKDDELNLTISESDEDKEPKKGIKAILSNKLFVMALILVLVASGATAWLLLKSPAETPEVDKPIPEAPVMANKKPALFKDILDLGTFEVPLGDMGGTLTLTVGVKIQATTPGIKAELAQRAAQIQIMVSSVIGNKTLSELNGVDGKIVLKHELTAGLNRLFTEGKALNMFFYEYLIK